MQNKKEWGNEHYFLTVWIEKGFGRGSLVNKQTGQIKDLSRIISDERDDFSYPSEISSNLHKILDELKIDPYTLKVRPK